MSRAARARKRQTFYANEPTTPLSEIHSRKWHKRLKVIGHMHIPKWVPVDQPVRSIVGKYRWLRLNFEL